MKQIPNIFTLLNMFFGCLAIVFSLQTQSVIIYVNDEFNSSFAIPEKLSLAAFCIGIAALIDFLDGFVARIMNATSEIGKQLDSLSDVVSFGVAPGVILYQLLRISFIRDENGIETSFLWLIPAFLVTLAAGYRLAKFNLDNTQSVNFNGMPTPAIGILVASFPLIIHYNLQWLNVTNLFTSKWFLYGTILLVTFLMLCNIRFMGLKFTRFTIGDNVPKIILFLVAIFAAILLHWLAVPLVFLLYIILSLLFKNNIA